MTGNGSIVATMTKYEAALLEGGWGVRYTHKPYYPLPAVRYLARPPAEKLADLLNAIDDEEPREILDRLRAELDEIRHMPAR